MGLYEFAEKKAGLTSLSMIPVSTTWEVRRPLLVTSCGTFICLDTKKCPSLRPQLGLEETEQNVADKKKKA